MSTYSISVYDEDGKLIYQDYRQFDDLYQAELQAKADCNWLGGDHYEVMKIN